MLSDEYRSNPRYCDSYYKLPCVRYCTNCDTAFWTEIEQPYCYECWRCFMFGTTGDYLVRLVHISLYDVTYVPLSLAKTWGTGHCL